MYAVFKSGGKQYRAAAGETVRVEKLPAGVGSEVVMDQVLLVVDGEQVRLGTPLVAGASVSAKVVAHGQADQVKIFKLRRRKHYEKHQGHRQKFTELEITGING
ncbi:MAG: 50S ribosomal protein L21 [Betaproteobacteria bacterium]|nr:50S ribosomal protein L21 [Betaproteobacteria bacterium]